MPNTQRAKQRVQTTEARTLRNKMYRSEMKTIIKKFDMAVESGDKDAAKAAYLAAVKKVDQASARGILHKNTASHRKSKFTKKLNALN